MQTFQEPRRAVSFSLLLCFRSPCVSPVCPALHLETLMVQAIEWTVPGQLSALPLPAAAAAGAGWEAAR